MKKIAKKSFIVLGVLYLVIFSTIGLTRIFGNPEYESGTVLHKSEELIYSKHGSHHKMYLVVKFKDRIKDVYVSTHSYLTTEVGSKATFKKDMLRKDWIGFFSFFAMCVSGLMLVFGIIAFFVWLYS